MQLTINQVQRIMDATTPVIHFNAKMAARAVKLQFKLVKFNKEFADCGAVARWADLAERSGR